MRHLQQLFLQYKDKGLVILGFNSADDKKIALDILHENGATFPNILDASDAAIKVAFQDYHGSGVPLNHIIDREGKIVAAWYGGEEGHAKAIATIQKQGGDLAEAIRNDWDAQAAQSAEEVTKAAGQLFQAIRDADYDCDWGKNDRWKEFPSKEANYRPTSDGSGWVRWVCNKFKTDPIIEIRLGKVCADSDGWPTVHFQLSLKDGESLEGDLRFERDTIKEPWRARGGLDWHVPKSP